MNDLDRIREAVSFVPAIDRDTWLRMGMAIKSEIGDTGFDLWDVWSQQAESYNARDARNVWKSIRANGRVTLGTLLHEAKAHGWRDDATHHKPPEELGERRRVAAERAAQEEAEIAREGADTAKKAAAIWKAATEAKGDHPYLTRKHVSPVATLREIDAGATAAILGYVPKSGGDVLAGRLLAAPIKVGDGLSTLELIDGDGRKAALAGRGTKAGGYWAAQPLPEGDGGGLTLLIGEGVATVLSGREASGHPAIAALSSGNLPAVAKAMRERTPAVELVILADLVKATGEPDPHAIEAARSVGGKLAIPDFGADRPRGATDFNDLHRHAGLEAVRAGIELAVLVESGAAEDPSAWPDPKPITAELKPVPAFDADTLLPEVLRAWIIDEAERMPCPPDFIAAAAVVALGSIVGARCAMKPKASDSWLIVPNLWGGIVGDPSAKKSPAWGAALKPMDRLIAKAREAHSAALADYETDKVVFEAHKDAIGGRIKEAARKPGKGDPASIARELRAHGEQAPDAPTLRRYKTNDSTVEKLGELLRENPAGLLVLRDELVGLIATWEREGREGERAFFLEGWNGDQSFDTDRIGRGHISIPNLCMSIFGGIQPDKLTVYLEQAVHALANDGMLQRFQLLVYPNARRWEWRDRAPDKCARDAAFAVFEVLADFDPVAWGAAPADDFAKFPHFCFDDKAQAVFIEWSEDMHLARMPSEDEPIIRQHLAKFDKLFPALALVFHLVDCAAQGLRGPVTKKAALRAAAWCEYLEAHARRCYGLLKDDGLRAAQALAVKLERGALEDGFTLRDVRRNQWRSLTTDEAIQAALDWLEDEDWLRSEAIGGTGPGSGRRTLRYRMHPAIKGKRIEGNA